ncbi:MAG: N-6 DNA methylase [Gammaproteobacteria bacterium]|nr:N-6 DNA methylase [Gammaproteobacteria bacterium]
MLREFFHHITGPNLSPDLARLVDSITDFLSRVDMRSILETQARKAGFEDPVFHFYETFLAAYDPKLRERRGVYYTPAPVVDFIVRGVDEILRARFNRADGLADTKTLILDPAVGTAAFLRRVVEIIRQTVLQQGRGGMWSGYVKDHLLPRIFGFELMMAPYTVAHLKLALQLRESNYQFGKRERLQIFLTNTLDQLQNESGQLMSQWLVDEAKDAEAVKNRKPVMVVLGNPPYSGESATRSQWSRDLIAEYKKEPDGSALKERTAKWLNDDYVKFIGFAQWRVKQTGHGVVAFIANHAWLDNPTFRGMRAALLRDFDEIRIVDLHGNVKKKERGPEGGKEENVFDIQQGVAVLFLIRREAARKKDAKVLHRDLWGARKGKYDSLGALRVDSGGWEEVKPTLPLLLFKPVNEALRAEYEKGWKVTEIFPINGAGMTTARDHMVIDFEKPPLLSRVSTFRDSRDSDRDLCARLQIPMKKGWNIAKARQNLQEEERLDDFVKPVLYRPFDWRLIFYHDALVWRTVKKVMRHMQGGKNVGLVTVRQQSQQGTWRHVGISDQIMEGCAISNKTKEINYLFPLYIYPETDERNGSVDNNRRPNLAPEFLQAVEERIGASPLPEEILHYVYAVLHSPAYRKRYAGFLKSDFPRLPLVSDKKLFYRLAKLGAQLADVHLMRAPAPENPAVKYPEAGSHKVEKVRHDEKKQRVYINKTQFFAGVPKDDWDFFIGGYQVLDKWLKSRMNRVLSAEEVKHYQRLVAVIQKTRQLMKKVDEAIGKWPMK